MDFTLKTYRKLLETLQSSGREFLRYVDYVENKEKSNIVILRHDVDRMPENALEQAKLENSMSIKGTYYFRVVPESFTPEIITKIADLGHEIGYHYEDIDIVWKQIKRSEKDKLIDLAFGHFKEQVEKFRQLYPVQTACMHGSPLSRYDNRLLWEKYHYSSVGIIGEPYLDTDFTKFAYLTDTGRCWNGRDFNIRDKVKSLYKYNYKTTFEIIDNIDTFPPDIMLNIHPERWNDGVYKWTKALVVQNAKNVVKFFITKFRNGNGSNS